MIVIPMAGLSSRFIKAGYDRPKWMLDLAGRPLIDWSLLSFKDQFDSESFLIICRDTPGSEIFIRSRADFLGIKNVNLVSLSENTSGQAETVSLGLQTKEICDSESLTIFNIDTVRLNYNHMPDPLIGDGWLECFQGAGDHWSFVRPKDHFTDRVSEVTEKVRISNLCSSGIYRFKDCRTFRRAYEAEKNDPRYKEMFVAPLYQRIIEAGGDVRYGVVPQSDILFSGTPDEYEAAKEQTDALVSLAAHLPPT